MMQNNQQDKEQIWRQWASRLHGWGMQNLAAVLLESLGPLTVLGAQLVYFGQPFVQPFIRGERVTMLAQMLEEPAQTHQFVSILREE